MKGGLLLVLAAGLVGIVALVASLAGGGGGGLDPVAQAADTTTAGGSFEMRIAGSLIAGAQTIPISGTGSVDPRAGKADLTMTTQIAGLGSVPIEERLAGTEVYMKFPPQLAARLPAGKQWMKLDLAAIGKAHGVDMSQLIRANGGGASPADMVRYLKAVGDSQVVGHETIRGVPTTHYKATIDVGKAISKLGDKQAEASLKQLVESVASVKEIPVDAWIDDAGRLRRESVQMTAKQASGVSYAMNMTIDLVRFGVPVNADPPPADQVLDVSALAARGSG